MSPSFIRSETELRNIIKRPPGTVVAKIASGPLKANPREFLGAARLALVASLAADDGFPQITAFGGEPGFLAGEGSDGNLVIPVPSRRRDLAETAVGRGFAGALLMVPGIRHTLRVNGPAFIGSDGASVIVKPDQSYAHCAKAFIRSGLWNPELSSTTTASSPEPSELVRDRIDDAAAEFIRSCPFAAIGTSLIDQEADVSPRGDPAGFVHVIDDRTLFIPERPGNRIADSLRNIIANPVASVLFMIPGHARTLEVRGEAHTTVDEGLRRQAEVNGATPKLGVLLKARTVTTRIDDALGYADLWNLDSYAAESELPTIGALVADPNGAHTIARRAMSAVTNRATDVDYKRNLY